MGIKGILLMCYDTEVAPAIVEPIPFVVVSMLPGADPLMHLFYNNLPLLL